MTDRFVHHLEHLMIYGVLSTIIVIEVSFAVWLLLKWIRGNMKLNWSPVLHIEGSGRRRSGSSVETFDEKVKKDMGPVEVDVKKNIVLNRKADESTITTDEVKKGKVKTQKDKLKKLRGR
tara:strand:+ start:26 stop:385 length:360 start_codon:yes stop_codon:yes gene_type:complete